MMPSSLPKRCLPYLFALSLWLPASQAGAEEDLTNLSFEELLDVEITSVSRRAQPLSEAAAAVFVITAEDIRRSGATSVPEALRMAPGLQVSQLSSSTWSVSSRGLGGRFANKLLVLVDGRTVYTPVFSGVYWEQVDVVMQDIERIEVIRGPGATLWGANAVNGVINIITKSAQKTQGGMLVVRAGTEEKGTGVLQYGDQIGRYTHARAFVRYAEHDDLVTDTGRENTDAWVIRHGGFRVDSELPQGDIFSVQGGIYNGDYDQYTRFPSLNPPNYEDRSQSAADGAGWHLLGRWERPLSVSSNMALQVYYDHFSRDEEGFGDQSLDTFDLDFQHRFKLTAGNDLIWGLGYRNISTRFQAKGAVVTQKDRLTTELWSGFLQDEIDLIENTLRLTLGSKFEHNDLTGFEYQPNARLLWRMNERNAMWGAVSRAVRTPSVGEHYFALDTVTIPPSTPPLSLPLPTMMVTQGNEDFRSEDMIAYELGYRFTPKPSLSFDLALFYDSYDNLRTLDATYPVLADDMTHFVLATPFGNKAQGEIYGLELAADWLARDNWRLALAYSLAEAHLQVDADSQDPSNATFEDNLPQQQLSLRSLFNPTPDTDFDVWIRYVDRSNAQRSDTVVNPVAVPAYWDLDVRFAWRPMKHVELSVVGQNLLNPRRVEGGQEILSAESSEVERGVYGSVKIEF